MISRLNDGRLRQEVQRNLYAYIRIKISFRHSMWSFRNEHPEMATTIAKNEKISPTKQQHYTSCYITVTITLLHDTRRQNSEKENHNHTITRMGRSSRRFETEEMYVAALLRWKQSQASGLADLIRIPPIRTTFPIQILNMSKLRWNIAEEKEERRIFSFHIHVSELRIHFSTVSSHRFVVICECKMNSTPSVAVEQGQLNQNHFFSLKMNIPIWLEMIISGFLLFNMK